MNAKRNLLLSRIKVDRDIRDDLIRRLTRDGGSFVRVRSMFQWSDKNDAALMREACRKFSVKSQAGRIWLAYYGIPAGLIAGLYIIDDIARAPLRELGEDV